MYTCEICISGIAALLAMHDVSNFGLLNLLGQLIHFAIRSLCTTIVLYRLCSCLRWCGGQDLYARVGHQQRFFKLSAAFTITCYGGPLAEQRMRSQQSREKHSYMSNASHRLASVSPLARRDRSLALS